MTGSDVLSVALLGYIAWRERAHAVERQGLLSRRGGPAPSPASSRRGKKAGRVRVISADDDAAFIEAKQRQEEAEAED